MFILTIEFQENENPIRFECKFELNLNSFKSKANSENL